jgi:hypothetical protein
MEVLKEHFSLDVFCIHVCGGYRYMYFDCILLTSCNTGCANISFIDVLFPPRTSVLVVVWMGGRPTLLSVHVI